MSFISFVSRPARRTATVLAVSTLALAGAGVGASVSAAQAIDPDVQIVADAACQLDPGLPNGETGPIPEGQAFRWDINSDGAPDLAAVDVDGDGQPDTAGFDFDEDGAVDLQGTCTAGSWTPTS